jgi:hypothetical protein
VSPSADRVPRPPADLDPLIECWTAGRVIVRCHPPSYHEREFNPTTDLARFRPLVHAESIVPTLYGADDLPGALSESVFHDVPVRGPNRRIPRSRLNRWAWCEVAPTRELRLVSLHGTGLKRVQVTHAELIECPAAHYAETVQWADALYDVAAAPDGLCWRSRQHNDSLALMLFGTRVAEDDLEVVRRAESLAGGRGADAVFDFAEEAGITVVA